MRLLARSATMELIHACRPFPDNEEDFFLCGIQRYKLKAAKGDSELSHLKDVIRVLQFVSTDG